MDDYIWLHDKVIRFEMAWPICASLVFHVLLVLILTTTSTYYPAVGPVPSFDIFWVTPSYAPLHPATDGADARTGPELHQETLISEKQQPQGGAHPIFVPPPLFPDAGEDEPAATVQPKDSNEDDEPPVALVTRIVTAPSKKPQVAAKGIARDHTIEVTRKKQTVSGLRREKAPASSESSLGQSLQSNPLPGGVAAVKVEVPRQADLQDEQRRIGQVKANQLTAKLLNSEQTPKRSEEFHPESGPERQSGEQEKANREKAERERISAQELERERRAIALAERKFEQARLTVSQRTPARDPTIPAPQGLPSARQQEARLAAPRFAPSPADSVATDGNRPAINDRKPAEPVVQEKAPKPSEKPHQDRGLVVASMRGDLKLVITGDDAIKLSVKFREFPRSRRNRVLTRSEARREQTITPVLARTREENREAVIEKAREGIYVFSAESERGKEATATFTLKIFESSSRERTAELGARAISGKTVLVKILMPEAILWDDESAFTGTLEDSDSVTKFNATTGLYWRESLD